LPDLADDADRLARLALDEDGPIDLTTEVTGVLPGKASGRIEFREPGVLAGRIYADAVAGLVGCRAEWRVSAGQLVDPGPVGRIEGSRAALLRVERPLLNLLQRASGIATRIRLYVERLASTGCRVLHTRKTAPGLRLFDAAAVVAGGGLVHRLDLAHTVMIKDNHWRLLEKERRPLAQVLAEARRRGAVACQVEVESEAQVREACAAGADRLLVDNQASATVRAWGELARQLRPEIQIEATGGITLENALEYARARADYISVGEATHSVRAANIAIELD
jgi:nicotinate-nucleotide pyrophosphorylase (carboxylating)